MANVLSALTQAAISIQSPERVSLRGEGYQIRTVGESESLSMSVWARHSGGWMDMAFKGLDYSKAGLRVLLSVCVSSIAGICSRSPCEAFPARACQSVNGLCPG